MADNEEGTYIELDYGHFMHNIEYKRISEEMKASWINRGNGMILADKIIDKKRMVGHRRNLENNLVSRRIHLK